jgi:dTDP-4-dehydrorhamnose reductase
MIILLGGTGYVGHAFSRLLQLQDIPFVTVSRPSCNYTDPATLRSLLQEQEASFVVNCAGYTGKPNVHTTRQNPAS